MSVTVPIPDWIIQTLFIALIVCIICLLLVERSNDIFAIIFYISHFVCIVIVGWLSKKAGE